MEQAEGLTSPHSISSAECVEEDYTAASNQAQKTPRRPRVSLACQRCKHRKQKCNGDQPTCARCLRLKMDCHYVMPLHSKGRQVKIYIKALEERVADLEVLLNHEGDKTTSRDHWEAASEDPEIDQSDVRPLLNAVRDLSLDVAGSYIGGASTITLGRALEAALAGKTQLILPNMDVEHGSRRQGSITSDMSSIPGQNTIRACQIDPGAADKMVHSYVKHLCVNFPIMFTFDILALHDRRYELGTVYDESILNLIYGLGAHFLEKTGEFVGSCDPETFYNAALDNRESILSMGNTKTLTYLLLLGQHCIRMPKDPGAWTYFSLAMKLCVELGLHRKKRTPQLSLRSELNKRLFWTCYAYDRELAIVMGRPPSLSDRFIDVDLPLDVDEDTRDLEVYRKAERQERNRPVSPQTTMSPFIHFVRLKKIESDIQHTIYRVDIPKHSKNIYQTTDTFLDQLHAWRAAIPVESTQDDAPNAHLFAGNDYRRYDNYMASYHKAVRTLLQPRLYESLIDQRYLDLCSEACRSVCQVYKRLHTKIPLVFSSVSLQTVFLAGLTLVYCMWHDFTNSNTFKNVGALTDCSIILYVMTERWPASRKYRDLFEVVKTSVLDAIAEGKHMPRTAVPSLKGDLQTSLQNGNLQVSLTTESLSEDLEQMINDITGEQLSFWGDVAMGGFEDAGSYMAPDNGASLQYSFPESGWSGIN